MWLVTYQELFPGQYTPSLSHRFVASLEKRGKLLRNYTQNIDTLEVAAGIQRAVFCHGKEQFSLLKLINVCPL